MIRLFASKVVRLAGGALIVAAVTALFGVSSMPVAARHHDPPCTATIGNPLPAPIHVTDSGLAPATAYSVFVMQPNGTQAGDVTYTDSSGNLSDSNLFAYWNGSYQVTISKFKSNQVNASCTAAV